MSTETPDERRLKRSVITNKIKNMGNLEYNKQIVEGQRKGEFLPVKRSSHNKHVVSNSTHVTCKHCSGFFKKDSFYRHVRNCQQNDEKGRVVRKNKRPVLPGNADLLVRSNADANDLLKTEVFPKMIKDRETVVVQSDGLISRFGSYFRFTHRGTRQIRYCSSRMRSLARLLLAVQGLKPEIKEFRECIVPSNFNLLVHAVRHMSRFDDSNGDTRTPSVPPRLCSSLKRCANIVKSDAIKDATLNREQKTETICEMNEFLHLMNSDWATEVGTNCENSRKRQKVIKDDLLPDPDDIRIFSKYIHDLCPKYMDALKHVPTTNNYERLAKLIIVHIITLNRRRPNETVEIPLEAYRSTLNRRADYGLDTQNVLSEAEVNSGKKLSIFYVPANKNLKKVPVLLTKRFNEAVETLIESREKIGVQSKYMFGRCSGGGGGVEELFDGSAVLREYANKAPLKNPTTFTANALRHHAATTSQLQPRNDTYTKRLSKFLGHDLRTHEHFYEMPLPMIQKTVVGHQLLQMTLPKSSESSKPCTVTSQTATATSASPSVSQSEELQQTSSIEAATTAGASVGEEDVALESKEEENSSAETPPRKIHRKVRWSSPEKRAIYEKFGSHLIYNVNPRRNEIKKMWEEEPSLKKRTLQQVVTYVNNIVRQKHHISTPMRKKIKHMVARGGEKLSP